MDDDYTMIKRKPLKLADTKKKKKHKKVKPPVTTNEDSSYVDELPANKPQVIITTATKAEQAFKAKQDSIAQARILKKASKTHKQRVEEFNKHLDSLSEHYDIPKVSWTK